jgi:synaptic vesicle membrane protein VAT-1
MKAVVLSRTGGPDVLGVRDWPVPAVGVGEVRVAVRAAGVNFADTMARAGLYPATPKRPCVLGYEVAGEVESIGAGVSGLVVGQRVIRPGVSRGWVLCQPASARAGFKR